MTEIDSRCIAFENDHTYILKTNYGCREKTIQFQNKISTDESKNDKVVLSQTSSTKNQENIAWTTSKNKTIQSKANTQDSNVYFLPDGLSFPLPSNIKVSQNNLRIKKVENTPSIRPILPKPSNTSKMIPETPPQSNTHLLPFTNIPSSIKLRDVTVKKSFVKPEIIVASQEKSGLKLIKPLRNKIVKDYENGTCTIKLSSILYKRIQSGEKLFMCMECDDIFTKHKDLLDHQIYHYKCDKKIINHDKKKKEEELVSNVKNEKVEQTKPNFRPQKRKLIFQGECIVCHSVFPDLEKHIITVHQNDVNKYESNNLNHRCHKCGMNFELKQHMRTHELFAHKFVDSNAYEHCLKDFAHKEEVENYGETDNDRMKYLCPYCDTGFSHSKGLKTHLVKHISLNNTENSTSEVENSRIEYSPSRPPEKLDQLFEEINNISNDVNDVYIERVTDDNYQVRFTNKNEDNENILSPLDSSIDENNKIGMELNKVSEDNEKCPINQQQTSSLDKKRISYTVCRICMVIVSYSRIGRHMKKKHNNAAPYQCEVCHAEFNRKHIMDDHRRKHTNDKPHKCIECSKCFTYKHHLNRHMMIVHNADSLEKPFKCSVCDKAFSFKEYLTLHVNSRHKGKHYMCQICGKSFSTNAALNKHQLCHTDERPFMCEHCGRTFKCKIHYETHTKNMHPGDQQMALPAEKFECNLCNKKFSTKMYRDMHFKRHNGQGHQCDICYKIFVSKAHMQRHIKIMHRN